MIENLENLFDRGNVLISVVYFKATISEISRTFDGFGTINWNQVLENVGGGFYGTSSFRVPVSGTYLITVRLMIPHGETLGNGAALFLMINWGTRCSTGPISHDYEIATCSRVLKLETGGFLEVFNAVSAIRGAGKTYFSGILLKADF